MQHCLMFDCLITFWHILRACLEVCKHHLFGEANNFLKGKSEKKAVSLEDKINIYLPFIN